MASYNPAREVESLPETHDEKWIPTDEEFLRFVGAAEKTSTSRYLTPWIWLRAYTGMRPRESFFLEWRDIDFDTNQVHVRPKQGNTVKNRRFRKIEMHSELRQILVKWREEWLRLQAVWTRRHGTDWGHDWVFIHPGDHTRRAQGYHRAFYEARAKAGLPGITSYTLRHYFISYCVMNDIPFFTIAKWVGHKNTKMIEEVYGHLNTKYRAEQMRKLRIIPTTNAA